MEVDPPLTLRNGRGIRKVAVESILMRGVPSTMHLPNRSRDMKKLILLRRVIIVIVLSCFFAM